MDQNLFNKLQRNFKAFIGKSTHPPIEHGEVFTFDSSHIGKRLGNIAKDIQIRSLIDAGMPEEIIKKSMRGKQWGWEVSVKKIFDYEKTFIFGYGNDEIGYKINFVDAYGNNFLCLVNTNFGITPGNHCVIDGTISEIDSSKKQIRLNRVKIIQKQND